MDILEWLVSTINNVGVPIAMLLYFVWRDAKYMDKIDKTLDALLKYIGKEE